MQRAVIHLGPVGDLPGGVAQAVNNLDGEMPGWRAVKVTTVRRPRDPRSPALALLAAGRIATARWSSGEVLIWAHLTQGGSFLREGVLLWWARVLGLPVGATLHGSGFSDYARRHPRLVKSVLGTCGVIFVLSDEALASVQALRIPSRTVLIRNPVRVPRSDSSQRGRSRRVLFAGEVGRRKGVDVLLQAWEQADLPGWELDIVGPMERGFEVSAPAGANVLGSLPNAAVRERLRSSALAVLPSRAETLPIFLLEAMAAGCPAVSTRVGHVGTLLADGRGWLISVDDVSGLKDALVQLAEDAASRERMAALARKYVEDNFSSSSVAEHIAVEWDRLLNTPPDSGRG